MVRITNVGAGWEIVKLTLTFNQADAFAKAFVPQPSFVSFLIVFFCFLFLSSFQKIEKERVGITNVATDWEIVKLTLTFSQADASTKSFVPQPSFHHEKQMVVLAIVCRCIGGFLDDVGDLK